MDEKLVIFGGSGFLSASFRKYSSRNAGEIVFLSQSGGDYNAYDGKSINAVLNRLKPTLILNLFALTNVDECEQYPGKAIIYNSNLPAILSDWADAYLLQISTDQLYNQRTSTENQVNIVNCYGSTKYLGEKSVNKEKYGILRTNFLGKSFSKNRLSFIDSIISQERSGKKLDLYSDVYFNPLHISTLVKIIDCFLENRIDGVFNAGSFGELTKAELIVKFFEKLGMNKIHYQLVKSEDIPGRVRRPLEMSMDISKLDRSINLEIPNVMETVNLLAGEYDV